MGSAFGKQKTDEDYVFHTDRIEFDAAGNLICRAEATWDKEEEVARLMRHEPKAEFEENPDYLWAVVDAVWMEAWLFWATNNKAAPRPGPCRNDRLLFFDVSEDAWKGRNDIVMASQRQHGDYRRITMGCWSEIVRLYPASGPKIVTLYTPDPMNSNNGYFDTSNWRIYADREPPEDLARQRHYWERLGYMKNVFHVNSHATALSHSGDEGDEEKKEEGEQKGPENDEERLIGDALSSNVVHDDAYYERLFFSLKDQTYDEARDTHDLS
jgi:hypothetical protein